MVKRHKSLRVGYISVAVDIHGVEIQVQGGLGLVLEEIHQQLHEVIQEVVQQGLFSKVSDEVYEPVQ